MRRALPLFLALVSLALTAAPGRAGVITGTHGVNLLGDFSGTVTYSPLNDTSALLQILLTNTSPAGHGGYLTGFAFNNPGNHVMNFGLSSAPAHFALIGWPSFHNSVDASPYGRFDVGAAVGGNFEGGGNSHHGLTVGTSGTFLFALTGQGLDKLTVDDFLSTASAPPGNAKGNPAFVVRFRGFDDGCGPDSDKVPLDGDPPPVRIENTPEPATVVLVCLGALALAGVTLFRRAK
jgi:hypothetical protein